ncbi:MAG: hypothetical protein A2381_14170 [Bdellovibrionales bacterium RIFOXYB1_FULL_37_110]|nr:MAG: hypothetical protein A2181_05405 [Bdellovibrionales bacterium RIFOXYA1_FULL_38_20]OFZ47809.1 MAG: hypothetical protein A2417_15165 [Bdellovibrionales bacterium RIFOXYC1_FULL_37_79]OFZ57556.1 MAG: hypothetical protein A2381_14170 [Bdellovibrionales bacterium RIFOXYB1_FULL_37_110]OFZ61624.1 MAG: hypothetical protein A2577_10570 [Bdellovibrionales bacterium RIFOXYD1_FULL_36_51]
MKKKLLIVMGAGFSLCALLLAGAIFYASTIITPDEVKNFTVKQLQQIFPNAKIELGKLDIGFGLYAKIEVSDLELKIDKKEKASNLFKVKNMFAKVPLWAIILGSGKVEVILDSPQIYYYQYSKDEHNWGYALGSKETKTSEMSTTRPITDSKAGAENKSGELSLPGFLSVLKLNFELKNLELHYSLFDSPKRNNGQVVVSIFRIKDLNFEKETVIQLASNINIKDVGSLDVSVIAELYLNKLVQESKLPIKTEIILNNVKMAQLKNQLPEIKTNINLEVSKTGEVNGIIKTKFGEVDLLDAKYSLNKKEINVDDILVKVKLAEILKVVGFDNKMLDMNQAVFSLSGNTKLLGDEKHADINLKFEMNPGINFKYEGIEGTTTINGSFKKSDFNVSATTKVLDGTTNFSLSTKIDPNAKKFDLATMNPLNVKIDLNNLKIMRNMISGILYKNDGKKAQTSSPEEKSDKEISKVAVAEKKTPMVLPPCDIYLGINQINIDKDQFSGKGYIKIRDGKIETKEMNFKLGDGSIALTHTTNIGKNNVLDNKFNLITKNINFSSFTVFLPPSIDKINGIANLTSSGDVVIADAKEPQYNVKLEMSAQKGEVKGLNLKNYLEDIVSSVAVLKNYTDKAFDLDDSFDLFSLKGVFSNSKYQIEKFIFDGAKQKIKISGSGELYPPPLKKEGAIELVSEDELGISKFLEKEAGTRILPIRLKGIGFSLKPDAGYTLKKLAEGAVKQQGKKAAKKLIDEQGDKLLNGLLKGKKNPLKGLFGN